MVSYKIFYSSTGSGMPKLVIPRAKINITKVRWELKKGFRIYISGSPGISSYSIKATSILYWGVRMMVCSTAEDLLN
jgi:hypothetical protein